MDTDMVKQTVGSKDEAELHLSSAIIGHFFGFFNMAWGSWCLSDSLTVDGGTRVKMSPLYIIPTQPH